MRRLKLLGPVQVEWFESEHKSKQLSEVDAIPRFRSRRTVGLLGYLVAIGRSTARDALAALFWPDEPLNKGRANLSRELHNLSRILPGCWAADRQLIEFVPPPDLWVDIYQLAELENEWDEASEISGGEFLEGLSLEISPDFDTWLQNERESWRSRLKAIIWEAVQGQSKRGRYEEALQLAQRVLLIEPWDESAHRKVMELLAWTGQRSLALRQYAICTDSLRAELDVDPTDETTAIYEKILAGALDLPKQVPVFLTDAQARRTFSLPAFVGRAKEMARLNRFLERALAGNGAIVFVTGNPGQGKSALLRNFSQQAMQRVPNLLVANGKCNAFSGIGDPFLPFRDIMSMLTGNLEGLWDVGSISREHAYRLWEAHSVVLEELLENGPQLLDALVPAAEVLERLQAVIQGKESSLERLQKHLRSKELASTELELSYLFQQITDTLKAIAKQFPLLLILDDIQWADQSSLSLLFHLGKRVIELDAQILIACAYRPEEVAFGRDGQRHPLAQILNEFKLTHGNIWVNLGKSSEEEERQFLEAILDIEPNQLGTQFRHLLFERTAGHPLFTVELLNTMRARNNLVKDSAGLWIEGEDLTWEFLPARVEAAIEERIDRLSHTAREILSIASVEGERFTAQVIAKVVDLPEYSVLRYLSQDLSKRHQLIRAQEEIYTGQRWISKYRFDHVLFQEYLYKELGRSERRFLHGRIASILEMLYEEKPDEMAVTIAHHFLQAEEFEKALIYSNIAAERAARHYESEEAIALFGRAIQLTELVPCDIKMVAKLFKGRGRAHKRLGNFGQADQDLNHHLRLVQGAPDLEEMWQAYIELGKLWSSRNYDRTREYFESALNLARAHKEPLLLAGSLNWMGNWHANDENFLQASRCHLEALEIFARVEDQQELAHTLDLLGIANLLAGNLDQCVTYYNQAITLFRKQGNLSRLASSLIGRATIVPVMLYLATVPARTPPDAQVDFTEALQIAEDIGAHSERIWAHWTYCLFFIIQGEFDRALDLAKAGVHLAEQIQHGEWVVATQFALGVLYSELYSYEQAKYQLEKAVKLAQALHSPQWIFLTSGALAGTLLKTNDLEGTQQCLDAVISQQTRMDTLGKRYCWVRRAELALQLNEPTVALGIIERLIATAPGNNDGAIITYLWQLRADAQVNSGQFAEAENLIQSAIDNVARSGERFLLWGLYASLGRYYGAVSNPQAAARATLQAQTIITELATKIPDEQLRESFLNGATSRLRTSR